MTEQEKINAWKENEKPVGMLSEEMLEWGEKIHLPTHVVYEVIL